MKTNLPGWIETGAVTAGAFIRLEDRYVFGVGPSPSGDRLVVYRLGGHIEPGETPWDCLAREAREESTLTVTHLQPRATLLVLRDAEQAPLTELGFPWPGRQGPPPLAVIATGSNPTAPLNIMFLARAAGEAVPSAELQGLLLLRPAEVIVLSREPMTLGELRQAGGEAVLARPLDQNLRLAPFLQVRLLARMLAERPDLLEGVE